jgi:hypothetical protein
MEELTYTLEVEKEHKKCKKCFSINLSNHHFCGQCGARLNSINKIEDSVSLNLNNTTILSYPEKLVSKVKLPRWLSLIIFWELLLLGDFVISYLILKSYDDFMLMAAFSAFFASICLNINYCKNTLLRFYPILKNFIDLPDLELHNWFHLKMKEAYAGKWPLLAGFLICSVAIASIYPMIVEISSEELFLVIYRAAFLGLGFFFTGIGVWALVSIISLSNQVAKYKVKVSVYQNSENSIMAMGSVFFRMALAIAIPYSMIVLVAILSPFGNSVIVLAWLGIAALLVFAFFLLPQIGVHNVMTQEKQQRLQAFAFHIESAMEDSLKNPNSENMRRLRELFELQNHINNMNEWPFNTNAIWQLITALLIPLLLAIIELWKV